MQDAGALWVRFGGGVVRLVFFAFEVVFYPFVRVGGQLLVAPGCHAFKVRRELGFFPLRQFVRGADHEFEGEDDERADEHAAHGAEDEAEQAVEEAEAGRFQHL